MKTKFKIGDLVKYSPVGAISQSGTLGIVVPRPQYYEDIKIDRAEKPVWVFWFDSSDTLWAGAKDLILL